MPDHPDVDATVDDFTLALIQDLNDLRAGKITNVDARARAQLAHEVLRSLTIQLQGMKMISENAKLIAEQ